MGVSLNQKKRFHVLTCVVEAHPISVMLLFKVSKVDLNIFHIVTAKSEDVGMFYFYKNNTFILISYYTYKKYPS
jgi:hypothetical protein